MVLWGVRRVYRLVVGLEGERGGKIYEMWRRTNSKTHGMSDIEVVHIGE